MDFKKLFTLHEPTIISIRNCWNLVAVAVTYLGTILALAILAFGFGVAMEWLAIQAGFDEKTREFLRYAGRAVFVILTIVSFLLMLGDVFKLVRYYRNSWGDGYGPKRTTEEYAEN